MIDIKYILEENDFLQLNLYFFKTEGKLKKFIYKTFIAYLLIIMIICTFLIWKDEYLLGLVLIIVTVIISIFHSRQMKKIYLKTFKKSIKQYETRFNKEVELKLSNSIFQVISVAGQSNFNLSQIDTISETNQYFIIKLKIEAIIIPKNKLENVTAIKDEFLKLSKKLNIKYIYNLNWEW